MIICLDQRTGGGCGSENDDAAETCRVCGRSLRFALALMDANMVIGSYRIRRLIGYGGGGAVYEADDLAANRRVAVKETFDSMGAQSFRDEFAALSQLQHPALPRYDRLFDFNGNGYLVMEFVPGQSLQELVDARGALPEADVLGYARQLCGVLVFLHSHNPPLLHRDIKPANVRLMDNGRVKLVDFGLLKQGGQQTRKTIRGLGTPAYAPIEQYAATSQHTDLRSDIYSLGATLYHLLSGVTPPAATERVAISPDPLVPLHTANPALSAHVAAAVEQAMAMSQAERFGSAASFAAALLNLPATQPKPLAPSGVPTQPAQRGWHGAYTFETERTILAHQEGVIALAANASGELLACGSADDTATVWRVRDGAQLAQLVGHQRGVNGLAFTADTSYIATGSIDSTIKFWQLERQAAVLTLEKHADWVLALAATPDARTLASGSADGVLWFWQMDDGLPIGSLQCGSAIWCIGWSSDGERFATGHEDGSLQLRRRAEGKLLATVAAHTNIVSGVSWNADGSLLATVSNDHTGMLWDTLAFKPLRSLDGHTAPVTSVAFAPDGGAIATGCLDGKLRLYRAADTELLAETAAHERGVNALLWLPGGQRLITAGMDGALRVWALHRVPA